jgi:FkbM family methyltransferase
VGIERLERLPNFLKRYGLFHGLRLGLSVTGKGAKVQAPAKAINLPDYEAPVWLRPIRSDYSIFWQSMVRRDYDLSRLPQTEAIICRAQAAIEQGRKPVILDCGGNIGLSVRSFARDFPFAHIVVVEPDQENMRVLAANAAELPGTVTPVLGGIASRSDHCKVVARDRGSAGFMTKYCDADDPESIRTFTVQELFAMVPDAYPWIVKLDIEGAQEELFSTNLDWIGTVDLILLELDDWAFPWGGTSINFFRALSDHAFDYLVDGELIVCFRHRD